MNVSDGEKSLTHSEKSFVDSINCLDCTKHGIESGRRKI